MSLNAIVKCAILLLTFLSALCLKEPSMFLRRQLHPLLLLLQNFLECATPVMGHLLPGDTKTFPLIMTNNAAKIIFTPAHCGPIQKVLCVLSTLGALQPLPPARLPSACSGWFGSDN